MFMRIPRRCAGFSHQGLAGASDNGGQQWPLADTNVVPRVVPTRRVSVTPVFTVEVWPNGAGPAAWRSACI